jgi:serine/threonine-protein kinase HipA
LSGAGKVEELVQASFLDDTTKRNYLQAYQARYKQLAKT